MPEERPYRHVFLLSALASCALLGLIVGALFHWAGPGRAWDNLLAGFLWVLLIVTGTSIGRAFYERVRYGEWWRGLRLGCEMAFLPATVYMLAVALASLGSAEAVVMESGGTVAGRPDMLMLAPVVYAGALVLALLLGPLQVLTSPFRSYPQPVSHSEPPPASPNEPS